MAPKKSSAPRNSALTRRLLEQVWNTGDMAAAKELIGEFYSSNVWEHPLIAAFETLGPAGFEQQLSHVRKAYPKLTFAIDRMVENGDTVYTEFSVTGEHVSRTFTTRNGSLAPQRLSEKGISITRFKDGKIQSYTNFWDMSTASELMEKLTLD